MRLQHRTEVAASPPDVWTFLQDTREVVRCLPGAELVDELGDDRYRGVLGVAVGPLRMNYAGDVAVVERSAEDRRIVLDASARDKRGGGAVRAHVRIQVVPAGVGSRLEVVSDVELSGRIAALGRGIRDVSTMMFVEFADRLGARVEDPARAASPPPSARAPGAGPVATVARPPAGGRRTEKVEILSLVWTVTRERVADLLERLSVRIRPR